MSMCALSYCQSICDNLREHQDKPEREESSVQCQHVYVESPPLRTSVFKAPTSLYSIYAIYVSLHSRHADRQVLQKVHLCALADSNNRRRHLGNLKHKVLHFKVLAFPQGAMHSRGMKLNLNKASVLLKRWQGRQGRAFVCLLYFCDLNR